MSGSDKTKLNGIAAGATANDTDANLKNRANHTGSQSISTVSGLQSALDGKLANPMTTAGDLILGGAAGAPTRLPIASTDGYVLTRVAGAVAWAAATGGMSNPMTGVGDLIIGGASGAPARLAPGTNGYVLTLVSGSPAWQAASGGGGGLTNLTEAKNTSAPNATVPVVSLSVTIAETNGDFALVPKASGSLLASIPDNGTTGGNKRGTKAIDLQLERSASDQIAGGNYSTVVGGRRNKVTGDHGSAFGGLQNLCQGIYSTILGGTGCTTNGVVACVVGGDTCQATADYTAVLGGSTNIASATYAVVSGGDGNQATAQWSGVLAGRGNLANAQYSHIAGGAYATTRGIVGAEARASGRFSSTGDAQRERFILRRATTDATASELSADGAAPAATTRIVLPSNGTYGFFGRVIARANATGDAKDWKFEGTIKRGANAAATALVAAVTPAVVAGDSGASAWTIAVTADTTNGSLAITVTGAAATSIKWVADVETVEVVG
ncbi:hypothetical protein D9M68_561660 [compost metagenome]